MPFWIDRDLHLTEEEEEEMAQHLERDRIAGESITKMYPEGQFLRHYNRLEKDNEYIKQTKIRDEARKHIDVFIDMGGERHKEMEELQLRWQKRKRSEKDDNEKSAKKKKDDDEEEKDGEEKNEDTDNFTIPITIWLHLQTVSN